LPVFATDLEQPAVYRLKREGLALHLAGMSSAEVAVQTFKKMEEGDFKTLAAIESSMKTFEFAPVEEIARASSLFPDRTEHHLRRLHKFGLVVRRAEVYVGYSLNYAGYDALAINALAKAGVLDAFGKSLGVGKEADVYNALTPQGGRVAVKFLRLGRTSFRQTRRKRGYLAEDRKASWLYQSSLAAEREFDALKRVYEVGVRVPEPLKRNRHVIVMSMIDGFKLADFIRLRGAKGVLIEILRNIKRAYSKPGIVHGDLSEYNVVLETTGHILIIDWPQYVEKTHPSADKLLERDVENIVGYFVRKFRVRMDIKEALAYVKGAHRTA